MPTIRQAVPAAVPMLLPLVEAYWRFEDLPGFRADRVAASLTQLLAEPRLGAGWIATQDGDAAGDLLAVYVFSLEHLGLTAEIDEFFVVPGARGRGTGAALLRTAESAFRRAGCGNVSLQLGRHNAAARAWYHQHGYAERSGYELLDKTLHRSAPAAAEEPDPGVGHP